MLIDCLAGLKLLPDNSVQCVITSPPYNKRGLHNGLLFPGQIVYDEYDDNMNEDEYEKWQIEILIEINRILKPDGSLFYNHKDRRFRKKDYPPEVFLSKSPLTLYQTIIWDKGVTACQNPMFFRPTAEKIFWLIKSSPTNSRTIKFYRHRLPVSFQGCTWKISPEKNVKHPAPFPLILPELCILATTDENDLILDPFAGSGTTLIAAHNLKRSYLGFDLSRQYQKLFNQRLIQLNNNIQLWKQDFTVEKILNKRIRNGSIEYLLKWKGFDETENTVKKKDFFYEIFSLFLKFHLNSLVDKRRESQLFRFNRRL